MCVMCSKGIYLLNRCPDWCVRTILIILYAQAHLMDLCQTSWTLRFICWLLTDKLRLGSHWMMMHLSTFSLDVTYRQITEHWLTERVSLQGHMPICKPTHKCLYEGRYMSCPAGSYIQDTKKSCVVHYIVHRTTSPDMQRHTQTENILLFCWGICPTIWATVILTDTQNHLYFTCVGNNSISVSGCNLTQPHIKNNERWAMNVWVGLIDRASHI